MSERNLFNDDRPHAVDVCKGESGVNSVASCPCASARSILGTEALIPSLMTQVRTTRGPMFILIARLIPRLPRGLVVRGSRRHQRADIVCDSERFRRLVRATFRLATAVNPRLAGDLNVKYGVCPP